jgi:small GTP-binding protein
MLNWHKLSNYQAHWYRKSFGVQSFSFGLQKFKKRTNMININKFTKLIPNTEKQVKRLKFLKEQAKEVRVAAFGKYNHGKSTLLNAMIGKEVFKTADKRETIKNAEYKHDGIVWIDTPGLDADVKKKDDQQAKSGAFQMADFIFLVHRVDAGELDKYELQLYQDMIKQDRNSSKKMCLVLTQIDQINKIQLYPVLYKIKRQIPKIPVFPVSATRYTRGLLENKPKFVQLSGIKQLFDKTSQLVSHIDDLRQSEIQSLINNITSELEKKRQAIEAKLNSVRIEKNLQDSQFNQNLDIYLQEVTQIG